MKRHGLLGLALLLALPVAAISQGPSSLYDSSTLLREKPRFEKRIRELFSLGIEPHLTRQEGLALRGVYFQFPLAEKLPLQFYSHSAERFVALPVQSLIFLEDLCTAYAWLHYNRYSLETIDEYVSMLRYRPASDFAGGRYPPPLKALQIPPDALDDPRVDELSLRLRNEAYAFILLHELGHILHGHRGYGSVTAAQARSQEAAVDRFALEVLERTATVPLGAVLYFQAQAYALPNRGQFESDGEWQSFLKTTSTHPLTADRLKAMALHLDQAASRTADRASRDVLRDIAPKLLDIADVLGDADLQRCMRVVAHRMDVASLAPRLPGAVREHLERLCGS